MIDYVALWKASSLTLNKDGKVWIGMCPWVLNHTPNPTAPYRFNVSRTKNTHRLTCSNPACKERSWAELTAKWKSVNFDEYEAPEEGALLKKYIPWYSTLDVRDWMEHNDIAFEAAEGNEWKWTIRCPWGKHNATIEQKRNAWPEFICPTCGPEKEFIHMADMYPNAIDYCKTRKPREPGAGEDPFAPKDEIEGKKYSITALGCDANSSYYYRCMPMGWIKDIKGPQHTMLHLTHLIPNLQFWAVGFFDIYKGKNGAIDWDKAAAELKERCQAKGYFNPEHRRGLGFWWDKDRIVCNLGDRIVVDGNSTTSAIDIDTDYFYDITSAVKIEESAADAQLQALLPLLERLPLKRKSDNVMLLGVALLGMIAGVLKWRPHLWLSGPTQTGKSQIFSHILETMWTAIGGFYGGADTTAPGMRQKLDNSTLPMALDEQQATAGTSARLKAIILLARNASTGTTVYKGSMTGHGGNQSTLRTCIAMNAVDCPIDDPQDQRRWWRIYTREQIDEETKKAFIENWKTLQRDLKEDINTETSLQIYARLVKDCRKVLNIIDQFVQVLADKYEVYDLDRGSCDQWGATLAAAWWSQHPDRDSVTEDEVLKFFEAYYSRDEYRKDTLSSGFGGITGVEAWNIFMSHIPHGERLSLGHMVSELHSTTTSVTASSTERSGASDVFLRGYGIRVNEDTIWIATGHPQIKKILSAEGILNYVHAFLNIKGCVRKEISTVFDVRRPARLEIPITTLKGEDENEGEPPHKDAVFRSNYATPSRVHEPPEPEDDFLKGM